MSEEDFALRASTDAPWWSKAPIWLSLEIIGVPSLIAIGAGYFLAANVSTRLHALEDYNRDEISQMKKMESTETERWNAVLTNMRLGLETQVKTCLHEAKDKKEQNECVSLVDHNKLLQRLVQEPMK